jgi:hypothetical protein
MKEERKKERKGNIEGKNKERKGKKSKMKEGGNETKRS